MKRPWSDIDPDEEKLLSQWKPDATLASAACMPPEMIRAYLEECLPEPEMASTRQHIGNCPTCASLARDLKVLEVAGLTSLEERRMRARIGLPVPPVAEAKPRRGLWLRFAPWLLAATCAALAIGVWIRTEQKRSEIAQTPTPGPQQSPPVARNLPVLPAAVRMPLSSLVWRGEDKKTDAYGDALAKALQPYRTGRYEEAVDALKPVVARYSRRAEGNFYLGVSLLLAKRPAEAVSFLQTAQAAGESSVSSEIPWYLAAALYNAGREPEAIPLLRALCDSQNSYRKEACAALGTR